MKQYLKNLFLALTGSNPFQVELEEAKQQLEKAAENMSAMQDQLYAALSKWEGAMYEAESYKNSIKGYQVLTENLRERIKEKDGLIKELQKTFDEK